MSGALAYREDCADYEIIGGQVYMMSRPSMNHQRISGNIYGLFDQYLNGKCCEAILEQDVYFSEEDNFIPDVMIVCNPDIVEDDGIHGVPDLVVEILSKSRQSVTEWTNSSNMRSMASRNTGLLIRLVNPLKSINSKMASLNMIIPIAFTQNMSGIN